MYFSFMTIYEAAALEELKSWQRKTSRAPSPAGRLTKKIQDKMNSFIPEKIHLTITKAIKEMVRVVLFGAGFTTKKFAQAVLLEDREEKVQEQIEFYKKTAAAEGGIAGAGGILLGIAEFPVLLSLKMKLLFDIASIYGFNVKDYKERLYILYVFQLAFCSSQRRGEVYSRLKDWDDYSRHLPDDIHQFEWRTFQQEYRDYIDLAKLAQLIPVIGAAVGIVVNYRLITRLGETAMYAYRMRLFRDHMKGSS
ncbi:MAG: EcsC family protein [Chitinophagales bacterium]